MAKLDIDDAQTAQIALDAKWRELAPIVDRAKVLKEEVGRRPQLADDDPEVDNLVRWLDTFDQQLAAIQAINDAPEVPPDDLRAARMTAEKLLDTANTFAPRVAAGGSVIAPQAHAHE